MRHPISPFKAARRLVARLSATVGERAALAWVHTAAIARHAEQLGLVPNGLAASAHPVDAVRGVVGALAHHPALAGFANPVVNPILTSPPPKADVQDVVDFWRGQDVVPDQHRPDGYLLGDLYPRISLKLRDQRTRVQTPRHVGELLLDLSYKHALKEWGPSARMIDPACGTGHIVIEAYVDAYVELRRLGCVKREAALAALTNVHGVDVDAYAALIARYRLVAMVCSLLRTPLDDAPHELPVQVAPANSLLSTTEPLLRRERGYHAVVTSPPTTRCVDPEVQHRYRPFCDGDVSLAVPFEPLMHELAVPGGWVARLTTDVMTSDAGRTLRERFLDEVDLRWIIDASGALGDRGPRTILVSRNQAASHAATRLSLGRPSPRGRARAAAWTAIVDAVARAQA